MFMGSWNKKVLIGVGLIIAQLIIFLAIAKRDNVNFNLATFFICSLPGLIGVFLIWMERARGRF